VAWFDFSGGHEMKDKSSDDDDRNGKDSAPQPFIRIETERKYPQTYRESDFGKDQSHRLTVLGARP
jgi:hypothetical protein